MYKTIVMIEVFIHFLLLIDTDDYSAWGDTFFLLIQTTVIALLVLHYNYSSSLAAGFVAVFSAVLYVLVGGLTPIDILWSMQTISIPIMFAGKVITSLTPILTFTTNVSISSWRYFHGRHS